MRRPSSHPCWQGQGLASQPQVGVLGDVRGYNQLGHVSSLHTCQDQRGAKPGTFDEESGYYHLGPAALLLSCLRNIAWLTSCMGDFT
jgi:hypothetical protein